jgi:hypothetical protein
MGQTALAVDADMELRTEIPLLSFTRERLFAELGRVLQAGGMKLSGGTIVDATLISAPSSTKNEQKARDPEMHRRSKQRIRE